MSDPASHLPVIVGVGQSVLRELPGDPAQWPTPQSLAEEAARAALADAGATAGSAALAAAIDTLAFVRINADSMPVPSPLGRCSNLPRAVAGRLGIDPAQAVYSIVGGQSPQQLVNEYAAKLGRGECDLVLLTGAEAIATQKQIARQGVDLSWALEVEGQLEDRGHGPALFDPYEIANGMGFPPQVYGAFEHAWRAEHGLSREAHRQHMSELFAPFSEVAARHRYAQFPTARSAAYLATESAENYAIADPFLKWHVAQDAVNQGAALLLTTVGKATELGIPAERWVFALEGADAQDKHVAERPKLSESAAMAAVLDAALGGLYVRPGDISHYELYSCFPCAVQFACDALGIDPFAGDGSGRLTQTGGLPFFGGAGNNYSMHGIASMVDRLRADPGSLGLVLANGGFLSKESVGLYSTVPNPHWRPVDNALTQARIAGEAPVARAPDGATGQIESFSVVYAKREPFLGYVLARTADGARFMARTDKGDAATIRVLLEEDPIGISITPKVGERYNILQLA
ncbi:MAG: acetyl-CoA acetyltransferase [Pseudomonadota bacterium]